MTNTLWIVFGVSIVVVIGFVMAIRAQLRENKEIDKNIDYSKLRPEPDDEENDE